MKTIKVRIALAVNARGEWAARGWSTVMPHSSYAREVFRDADMDCADSLRHYWIEAEVEVPDDEPRTVQATAVQV